MYPMEMLGELGLPDDLIEEVRGMLADRAHELEGSKPGPMGQGMFGGSDSGMDLGQNASVARNHVADAVLQMADGLRGFREGLSRHAERMHDTDTAAAIDMDRIHSAADRLHSSRFDRPSLASNGEDL